MNINEFMQLIKGSLRYEINDKTLTLTGYYTGKEVSLDLSRITEEMLEELIVEDEEESEEE